LSRFARIIHRSAAPSLLSTRRLAAGHIIDKVAPLPRAKARRATRWCSSPLCNHCRGREVSILKQVEDAMTELGIVPLGPWRTPSEWLDGAGAPLDRRERS